MPSWFTAMAHFPSFRLPILSHPVSHSAKQAEILACPALLNGMRGELGPGYADEKTSLPFLISNPRDAQ